MKHVAKQSTRNRRVVNSDKIMSAQPHRGIDEEVSTILSAGLRRLGLDAEVTSERVKGTRLYRFFVIAKKFRHMYWASERQTVVWRILERDLPKSKLDRISMIMTLTPDDEDCPTVERVRVARIKSKTRSRK